MTSLINFVSEHYALFLTCSIILLFGVIGYIVDTNRNKNDLVKKNEEELDESILENIDLTENKSIGYMVSKSKNINLETMNVDLVDEDILKEENK